MVASKDERATADPDRLSPKSTSLIIIDTDIIIAALIGHH
jgi:hypothetical protein